MQDQKAILTTFQVHKSPETCMVLPSDAVLEGLATSVQEAAANKKLRFNAGKWTCGQPFYCYTIVHSTA